MSHRNWNPKKIMMSLSREDFKDWCIENRENLRQYIESLTEEGYHTFESWWLTQWDMVSWNALINGLGEPNCKKPTSFNYDAFIHRPWINGVLIRGGEYHLGEGGERIYHDSQYYKILPELPEISSSGYLKVTIDEEGKPTYEWKDISGLTNAVTWYPAEDNSGTCLWKGDEETGSEITSLSKFYNKTQLDEKERAIYSEIDTQVETERQARITADAGMVTLTNSQSISGSKTFTSGNGVRISTGGQTTSYYSDRIVAGANTLTFPNASGTIALEGQSGGAEWGSITGTLSKQTDLQKELDTKQFVTDTDLETQNKTIVGAINEVNDKAQGTTVNYAIDLQNPANLPFVSTNDTITATSFVTTAGVTVSTSELMIGASVYNTDAANPDRWYAGEDTFYILRGEKPDLSSYQKKQDTNLQTTDKTIVGAINENKQSIANETQSRISADTSLQSQINNKQDKTDNTLTTTDKTVVGAINEVNAKPIPSDTETLIFTMEDDTEVSVEVYVKVS